MAIQDKLPNATRYETVAGRPIGPGSTAPAGFAEAQDNVFKRLIVVGSSDGRLGLDLQTARNVRSLAKLRRLTVVHSVIMYNQLKPASADGLCMSAANISSGLRDMAPKKHIEHVRLATIKEDTLTLYGFAAAIMNTRFSQRDADSRKMLQVAVVPPEYGEAIGLDADFKEGSARLLLGTEDVHEDATLTARVLEWGKPPLSSIDMQSSTPYTND